MKEWKDSVYASYLSNGFQSVHNMKNEFELHRKYFKRNYAGYLPASKNSNILDLGCGMGQFLYFCKKEGYKNCTGIDASGQNIAYIKAHHFLEDGYQLYQASIMEFLKEKTDCYDVIVLNDVIEHLTKEEIFDVLSEVKKALKPGGRFLIKTPNMANPFVAAAGRYIDMTHETGFTEASMRQALTAAGFQNITIKGTDIYVLHPVISFAAKSVSRLVNLFLFLMSALYGRTSIRIFEKDLLAVACRGKSRRSNMKK